MQLSRRTLKESGGGKNKTNLFLDSFCKSSVVLVCPRAHLNPRSWFICLDLCMRPSYCCCLYLLMVFLFCITRTNLIRAKGIQISSQPPKRRLNEGTPRKRDGKNNKCVCGELRELLEECDSLNKLMQFHKSGPVGYQV